MEAAGLQVIFSNMTENSDAPHTLFRENIGSP
jgi:hypothetical protein